VFIPPPKVKSGVIKCIRKNDFVMPCSQKLFFDVVKTAFNQRRKTLRNALHKFNLKETDEFAKLRAEQLGVDEFIIECTISNDEWNVKNPIVLAHNYSLETDEEKFMLHCSTDFGGLLIDGFGDGIFMTANAIENKRINQIAFGILQAARTRISKTEYISCPSCGRTLFDLQETTAMIRNRTDHLKGIKIAIMGCIVNGPGEMADADYGYVGSGVGKITLYKGKEVVKRNIASENAVNELIELIKDHGDWVEL
jgi:hypothetical protein